MIRRPPARAPRDTTIALINIVFLMLVFLLIAGTLAPPLDPDVTLVRAADLDGRAPPDALVLGADGGLSYRGGPVDAATHLAGLDDTATIRIVPDRDAPAERLVAVAAELRAAGAEKVMLVTEQGLP